MKAVRHYIYVRGAATTSGAASPPPSSRSLPSPIPMVLPMTIGPPASPTRSASPGLLPTTPLARCSHSSAFDRSDRLPNVGGSPIRNRPFHPLSHLPHLAREMRTSKPQVSGVLSGLGWVAPFDSVGTRTAALTPNLSHVGSVRRAAVHDGVGEEEQKERAADGPGRRRRAHHEVRARGDAAHACARRRRAVHAAASVPTPPSPTPHTLSLARSRSLQRSPFISDTIPCDDLGIVEELLVEVGQEVKQDEVIAVIETHKAAIDVKASHAGVVTGVYVEQDEEVYEVQPMFMIRKAA